MSPESVGFAVVLLAAVMLLGKYLRVKVPALQKLLLPSAIVAGFLGLILGPQVLGKLGEPLGWGWLENGGLFTEEIYEVWGMLPGLLISVVFATLFLGARIPSPKRAAKLVGPQLSVGVAYGSGQYVVGILLALLVLAPLFGVDPLFGALIEIAFEGGHGTAAGMQPAFEEMGIPEATDLALAMATVGLVAAILIGIAVINWGVRTGRTKVIKNVTEQSDSELRGLYSDDETVHTGRMTARPASIEPLTLHVAVVGLAIILGWLILEGLVWVEDQLWGQPDSLWPGADGEGLTLLGYVPLFPLAMIGGVLIQVILDRTGNSRLLDHETMKRIQGLALDILIVAALATISLTVIADYWQTFLILSIAGVAFCTFMLLYFTPRIIPAYWLERGIADFGQSMGVTATGLALLRVADPDDKSPALEAFGYKQLFFEPFFGGGLITAISIPVMFATGSVLWILIPMAVLFVISLSAGMIYHRGVKSGKWSDPAAEVTQV
ncbi:sodium/glutamate symporter [Nesterenkonia lacusekhoensis]|uniref:ESS family glutamate:Na+ symporter n=1 Tax=Nesterenkonia lacusekhoensis TaxID=150832 RepID=A0ABS4SYK9_9MICC|nr:sodium/glutamate symporter [Nesterenkonia lacusekhoensis]MBP2317280.1 ESS family glutamate:Na+ symporter [Nesterenkonia lacusekhoensis]